ncbi:MAG TPA: hypothetical protein VJJ76_01330 [archaeon]|nr:hypothetical protein [archaeon]
MPENFLLNRKALSKLTIYLLILGFYAIYQVYFLQYAQITFAATPIVFSQNQSTPASQSQENPNQNKSFSIRITPTSAPVDRNGVIFQLGRNSTGSYFNYTRCQNGGQAGCTWNNSVGVFRINFTGIGFGGAGSYNLTWYSNDSINKWNKTQTVVYVLAQAPGGPGPSSQHTLNRGWNLISFDVLQVNSITNDNCRVQGRQFYYLNSQTKIWEYYTASQLRGGKGYWVIAEPSGPGPCTFDYTGSGTVGIPEIPPLKKGWNLIGTTSGSSYDINSIIGTCAGKIGVGPLYWNSQSQSWVTTTTITQKSGYWIYVTSDCQLA